MALGKFSRLVMTGGQFGVRVLEMLRAGEAFDQHPVEARRRVELFRLRKDPC